MSREPDRFGLIVGAMKSATLAVYKMLGQHPQVATHSISEPDFFETDAAYSKGISWYKGIWKWQPGIHKIAIDRNTDCTKVPFYVDAPMRIVDSGLDIKILYLVRNPLDRVRSHYRMATAEGWHPLPLDEGLDPQVIAFTRYHYQMSYYEMTDLADRLLVLSIDDLRLDQDSFMGRIFSHFGIDPAVPVTRVVDHEGYEYERALVEQELEQRGYDIAKTRGQGIASLLGQVPECERQQIRELVSACYQPSADRVRQIHHELKSDMLSLRDDYGIDVERWGYR